MLTYDEVHDLLAYDPETGIFTWKVGLSYRGKVGQRAGFNSNGYRMIGIRNIKYREHHLAWLLVYGVWPTYHIDHKNGNPADNRISNLREATTVENNRNVRIKKNNQLGVKGVHKRNDTPRKKPFRARIKVDYKEIFLGNFATAEEAHQAYCEASKKYHGDFGRTT